MKTKLEEFIEKAKACHPNENLDYSEAVYVNNRTPLKIIDHSLRPDGTEYGEFWQTPSNHLKGQSHPDKRARKISQKKALTYEDLLPRLRASHPNEKLEYPDHQEIENMHSYITIIDHDLDINGDEYGEYRQEINAHLKGSGHPRKARDRMSDMQRKPCGEYIESVKEVHKDCDYDYSQINYINNHSRITVVCNKIGSDNKPHGPFVIMAGNFLHGKGCPKCANSISKCENEIYEYVKGLLGKDKVVQRARKVVDGYEIDIYIPSRNIGIEYNGLYWHSERQKDKWYHINKTIACNKQGIRLVQIFEDEYTEHKEIVLSKIRHLLGIDNNRTKYRAHRCIVREILKSDAEVFLNQYHIQGFTASTLYTGAFANIDGEDVLVGVMTYKRTDNTWELNRFATNYHYNINGLGGKLFKWFTKRYEFDKVISFADRRWTLSVSNNLYTKLGFKLENITKPDYKYVVDGVRKHKFLFKKEIVARHYNFPLTMSELDMTRELGLYRIWDCGMFKYVYKPK